MTHDDIKAGLVSRDLPCRRKIGDIWRVLATRRDMAATLTTKIAPYSPKTALPSCGDPTPFTDNLIFQLHQ